MLSTFVAVELQAISGCISTPIAAVCSLIRSCLILTICPPAGSWHSIGSGPLPMSSVLCLESPDERRPRRLHAQRIERLPSSCKGFANVHAFRIPILCVAEITSFPSESTYSFRRRFTRLSCSGVIGKPVLETQITSAPFSRRLSTQILPLSLSCSKPWATAFSTIGCRIIFGIIAFFTVSSSWKNISTRSW